MPHYTNWMLVLRIFSMLNGIYNISYKRRKVPTIRASDLSFSRYFRTILIIYFVRGMIYFSFVKSNIP